MFTVPVSFGTTEKYRRICEQLLFRNNSRFSCSGLLVRRQHFLLDFLFAYPFVISLSDNAPKSR